MGQTILFLSFVLWKNDYDEKAQNNYGNHEGKRFQVKEEGRPGARSDFADAAVFLRDRS